MSPLETSAVAGAGLALGGTVIGLLVAARTLRSAAPALKDRGAPDPVPAAWQLQALQWCAGCQRIRPGVIIGGLGFRCFAHDHITPESA